MTWEMALAVIGVAAIAAGGVIAAMALTANICGRTRQARHNKQLRELLEKHQLTETEKQLRRGQSRGKVGRIIEDEDEA